MFLKGDGSDVSKICKICQAFYIHGLLPSRGRSMQLLLKQDKQNSKMLTAGAQIGVYISIPCLYNDSLSLLRCSGLLLPMLARVHFPSERVGAVKNQLFINGFVIPHVHL